MSEPFLPVPPPERGSYWNPAPARCPECRAIVQNPHSASRKNARWEGWCPTHGTVQIVYPSQESEIDRKEES